MPSFFLPILLALVLLAGRPATGAGAAGLRTVAAPADETRVTEADPADFLPSGTSVLHTAPGDLDGDGQDDLAVLYALPAMAGTPPHAGLLLLLGAPDGPRPVQLFGEPPHGLRGEPVLDPSGTTDLAVRDLTGDDRPEVVLRVTNRFQAPAARDLVWVFDRDAGPAGLAAAAAPPAPEYGPPAPPWAGTGFRLAAFLEGEAVEIEMPDGGGPAVLRRHVEERGLRGPDPVIQIAETYNWRGEGFRLTERALTLPPGTPATRSPETAVLGFYAAVARGDDAAAADFLDDEARASLSADLLAGPTAAARALRVEEARLLDSRRHRPDAPERERLVYVRVSLVADASGETAPASESGPARAAASAPRHTVAGTWRVREEGGRWRLVGADLRQTADLAAVADALPTGTAVLQTASGDVRGRGADDVVVLASGPGRYRLVEPVILFAGPSGFEPAVPLVSYTHDGLLGGPAGTVLVEDVTGDGRPEVVFSGIVGAHSATLWVLGWEGSTLTPLFEGASNAPVAALEHLDDDAMPEIVLSQSGYCGSYAASPQLTFAFRWEGGAYRAATWRYPTLNDGLEAHGEAAGARLPADPQSAGARACIQHMIALANALRDRPAEARAAYRAYAALRALAPDDAPLPSRPIYLGEAYVEAELRAALDRAASGPAQGWGPAERAVLHDLLGDALSERARTLQYEAQHAAERGLPDAAGAARRRASEARAAAAQAYRAALALDPTDEEARRALGE